MSEAKQLLLNQDMVRASLTCAKCGKLSRPFPCCHCGSTEFLKQQTRRIITVPWVKGKRVPPYEPYYTESDGKLLSMDEYGDYHPIEKTSLSSSAVSTRL